MMPNKPHTTPYAPNPSTESMASHHGEQKEELKNLAARQAIRFKVSYEWSGGKVLLALIIGAARLEAHYPALEAYVQPDQPDNNPNAGLGAQPSADDIRDAKTANDTLKRDWAVLSGFRR